MSSMSSARAESFYRTFVLVCQFSQMRALMCVGAWSKLGFVKDKDVIAATRLPEIEGNEKELAMDWDTIG